ncbi:MAG TPA: helix-turn-helix transcriptional regulator [Clostridiales bacterium]|nr:helix-turn-helix transcriptional regulator [Clostridiales bacterium]
MLEISSRQRKIISIVKNNQPITSERIADTLNLSRAALRSDLAVLTMAGILNAKPKVGYVYTGKTSASSIIAYLQNTKIKDIKAEATVVDENTSIYDAIVNLFLEDVGTLFIVKDGFLTGVVSRKDLLKSAMGNTDINRVPVGIVMTRMPNIVTVYDDSTVIEAAKKILEREVDSLPVVEKIKDKSGTENYRVVGKVSKTTITKFFVKLCDMVEGKHEDK